MKRIPLFQIEIFFLFFLVAVGLALVFITPPFQAPDEYGHFYRAYAMSELDFTSVERSFPESIVTAFAPVQNLPSYSENKIRASDILQAWQIPLQTNASVRIYYSAAMSYPALIYIPQMIGLALGRFLGFGPIGLLTTGRILNLFSFGLMGLLALRLLPSQRWLFLALLLMPMLIFLAASLSPDAMTDGLALVLIACVLRFVSSQVEMITWRKAIWLALICGLVAATKVPYFLIPLIVFLIPASKFDSRKNYWLKLLLIFGTVGLVVIAIQLPILIRDGAIRNLGVTEEQGTPGLKLQAIEQSPFQFLSMFFLTIREFGGYYFRSYIGLLGWNDTLLARVIYYTYPFALLGLAMTEGVLGYRLSLLRRAFLLVVTAGIFFILHVLLYLSWSPPDSTVILGLQGRYFIPFAPLLFVMVSGIVHNDKFRRLAHIAAAIYLPVVLVLVIHAVVVRYYSGW